jgi:hypothetical protein
MYGLKEAGKLSNFRLVSLLSSAGFIETRTPCLFRHLTHPIAFVLVVDDFGVKYQNRDDFDFLVSSLSRLYQVKAHPVATKFLGFALAHDHEQRTMTLSYPGCINSLLFRLRPDGIKSASSPSTYVPSHYGSSAPPSHLRFVPPATPTQKKELQVAIGYLLYYGRCVDGRVLPATCALASAQTTATQRTTMAELDRLLGFVAAHRDGRKVFRPSDMTLDVFSDASYLSRPKAGNVAGSFHHLSRRRDRGFVNAPISVHSTGYPLYARRCRSQSIVGPSGRPKSRLERQVLEDLGYPQPPTVIHCDNEVAVGLACPKDRQSQALQVL